jgi:hypothetical protein
MIPAQEPVQFAPYIVNGTMTSQYATIGVLLGSNNFGTARMLCSGTMIGCGTFLTAGHCVNGNLNPSSYSVFLQHAGFFDVSSIAMRSDFDFPDGDVAVIKLSTPVTGIAPTPIDTAGALPFGSSGTIVGFGSSGGRGNSDYGIKRVGAIRTAPCSGDVSDTTSVCWDFTDPLGSLYADGANTCNGDSGGPLFIDSGAGSVVAGVTSGGANATCLATDHSYDANVFFYRSWIQAKGGPDLNNTSCGSLPQVGQLGTNVLAAPGQLGPANPQGRLTVQVPADTMELRVSMNAVDDGSSDFDLYVKYGSPASPGVYDCKADGRGQYGFCQFTVPAPGTWYLLVDRVQGSGAYQLTATTFAISRRGRTYLRRPNLRHEALLQGRR